MKVPQLYPWRLSWARTASCPRISSPGWLGGCTVEKSWLCTSQQAKCLAATAMTKKYGNSIYIFLAGQIRSIYFMSDLDATLSPWTYPRPLWLPQVSNQGLSHQCTSATGVRSMGSDFCLSVCLSVCLSRKRLLRMMWLWLMKIPTQY